MSEEGRKFNEGKSRPSLIAPSAIAYLARVCQYGVALHGEQNCEKGFKYNALIDAFMRHVEAFRAGENLDPESGLPHLAHAMWNISRLLDQCEYSYGEDDRLPMRLRHGTTYEDMGREMKRPPTHCVPACETPAIDWDDSATAPEEDKPQPRLRKMTDEELAERDAMMLTISQITDNGLGEGN